MNEYEIALSFAGEQRCYVKQVAQSIQSRGVSVFYDEFEKVELWGKHAAEEFQQVYERRANVVVMFISRHYVDKAWPRHERRSILSRAVQESREFILPVQFDDTEVPGLPGDIFYLRAEEFLPAEIAAMALEKLGVGRFEGKASQVPPPRMTSLTGEVVFDYSSHNGRYVIGRDTLEFETVWTKASDTSIHVYNHSPSINGIALAPRKLQSISQVTGAELLDYTSDWQTPRVGQIVLFRNTHGFYAAVQVLAIKGDIRDDDCDELRFRYVIQPDGLDSFGGIDAGG
ncbi:MAG: TIR domain-containing protein [Chloroflexi bacterium]|nr:TIR domain-containing protein [Chloroflexota bacterium]